LSRTRDGENYVAIGGSILVPVGR